MFNIIIKKIYKNIQKENDNLLYLRIKKKKIKYVNNRDYKLIN